MTNQQQLWHDTIYDSVGAAVDAIGGSKVVAHTLWPAKNIIDGSKYLRHCLNEDRNEKISLDEFVLIWRLSRNKGCHTIAQYIANTCFYNFTPIEPEDRKAELQREFNKNLGVQKNILELLNKAQEAANAEPS